METYLLAERRPRIAISDAVVALAAAFIAVCWCYQTRSETGSVRTVVLFLLVVAGGMSLIHMTARKCGDPGVLNVRYVFLIKIALILVFASMWASLLETDPEIWKPDQQRYFDEAEVLARSNFDPRVIPNINYPGVLYVYGAVFALFGHNAYAAALFNSFLTLLTTLLLMRVAYRIKSERGPWDWLLAFLMIVPEVLVADVMTSRDALVMSLLSIAILATANYLLTDAASRHALFPIVTAIPAMLLLAIVRTSVLIPAVASLAALWIVFRTPIRRWAAALIVIGTASLLLVGPTVSERLGGYRLTYVKLLSMTAINPDPKFIDGFSWTARSIGRLLVPHSILQALLFSLPRSIAYIIVPLPHWPVDWNSVVAAEWIGWQALLTVSSSVIYVALFPLVLVASWNAIKRRGASLAFVLPFWISLIAIASGTAILHERYRVMAAPFLCGCLWLARTAPRRQLMQAFIAWGSFLLTAAAAVFLYKQGIV